jgi:hypothetical protein
MGMTFRIVIATGLTSPSPIQVQELFQHSALQLQALSELRINLVKTIRATNIAPDANARRSIDQLSRHIRLLGKFFRRLQQLNVAQFVELPVCSDIILYYWAKVVEATNAPPEMISGALPGFEKRWH